VWAVKDPDDGNLDRIQIIKGWTKQVRFLKTMSRGRAIASRSANRRVPPVGNTVDIKDASYKNDRRD
jgi:hypothetical protein